MPASLLTTIRNLVPLRPLSAAESYRLAELQAQKLLAALGITNAPVPDDLFDALPRVRLVREPGIGVAGSSDWANGTWTIVVNADEPRARQRFTAAHELKHVLDGHVYDRLYRPESGLSGHGRAELVCNYFAACLLMPRSWVKRLYCDERVQDIAALARRFNVSQQAMRTRLDLLGLLDPVSRHGEPISAIPRPERRRPATTAARLDRLAALDPLVSVKLSDLNRLLHQEARP